MTTSEWIWSRRMEGKPKVRKKMLKRSIRHEPIRHDQATWRLFTFSSQAGGIRDQQRSAEGLWLVDSQSDAAFDDRPVVTTRDW